jgi:hypothetical protein
MQQQSYKVEIHLDWSTIPDRIVDFVPGQSFRSYYPNSNGDVWATKADIKESLLDKKKVMSKTLSAYVNRTTQYCRVKNVNKGVELHDLNKQTIRLNFDLGENIIVDDDGEGGGGGFLIAPFLAPVGVAPVGVAPVRVAPVRVAPVRVVVDDDDDDVDDDIIGISSASRVLFSSKPSDVVSNARPISSSTGVPSSNSSTSIVGMSDVSVTQQSIWSRIVAWNPFRSQSRLRSREKPSTVTSPSTSSPPSFKTGEAPRRRQTSADVKIECNTAASILNLAKDELAKKMVNLARLERELSQANTVFLTLQANKAQKTRSSHGDESASLAATNMVNNATKVRDTASMEESDAQQAVFLADSTFKNLKSLYDLLILTEEAEKIHLSAQSDLNKIKTDTTNLQRDVFTAETTLKELQAEKADKLLEISAINLLATSYVADITSKRNDLLDKEERITTLNELINDSSRKITTLEGNEKNAKESFDFKTNALNSLKKDVEKKGGELESLSKILNESKAELDLKTNENSLIKTAIEDLNIDVTSKQEEKTSLVGKITRLEGEITSLSEQSTPLEVLVKNATEEKTVGERLLAQVNQALELASKSSIEKNAELEALNKRLDSMVIESALTNNTVRDLNITIGRLKDDESTLQEDITTATNELRRRNLFLLLTQEQHANIVAKCQELELNYRQVHKRYEQVEITRQVCFNQLIAVNKSLTIVEERLIQSQRALNERTAAFEIIRNRFNSLVEERVQLEQDLANLSSHILDLESSVVSNRSIKDRAVVELEHAKKNLDSLTSTLARVNDEAETLTSKITISETSLESLRSSLASKKTEDSSLTRQITLIENDLSIKQSLLVEKKNDVAAVKKEVAFILQKSNELLQSTNEQVEKVKSESEFALTEAKKTASEDFVKSQLENKEKNMRVLESLKLSYKSIESARLRLQFADLVRKEEYQVSHNALEAAIKRNVAAQAVANVERVKAESIAAEEGKRNEARLQAQALSEANEEKEEEEEIKTDKASSVVDQTKLNKRSVNDSNRDVIIRKLRSVYDLHTAEEALKYLFQRAFIPISSFPTTKKERSSERNDSFRVILDTAFNTLDFSDPSISDEISDDDEEEEEEEEEEEDDDDDDDGDDDDDDVNSLSITTAFQFISIAIAKSSLYSSFFTSDKLNNRDDEAFLNYNHLFSLASYNLTSEGNVRVEKPEKQRMFYCIVGITTTDDNNHEFVRKGGAGASGKASLFPISRYDGLNVTFGSGFATRDTDLTESWVSHYVNQAEVFFHDFLHQKGIEDDNFNIDIGICGHLGHGALKVKVFGEAENGSSTESYKFALGINTASLAIAAILRFKRMIRIVVELTCTLRKGDKFERSFLQLRSMKDEEMPVEVAEGFVQQKIDTFLSKSVGECEKALSTILNELNGFNRSKNQKIAAIRSSVRDLTTLAKSNHESSTEWYGEKCLKRLVDLTKDYNVRNHSKALSEVLVLLRILCASEYCKLNDGSSRSVIVAPAIVSLVYAVDFSMLEEITINTILSLFNTCQNYWMQHGVHRALLHITSFQKSAGFKSYLNSLCRVIYNLVNHSEKTDFELRKDAFISAGALPILKSLRSKLARDEDDSEGRRSYHYLDQAISLLNGV